MASASDSAKPESTEDDVRKMDEKDPDYEQRQRNIQAALSIFSKMDRDEGYISYMLIQKLFGQERKCHFCGVKGPGKVPKSDECLELYVGECGVIARQDIQCLTCGRVDIMVTCEDLEELPSDRRLRIQGDDACQYYRKITHFEILHDLMKMLRIAALDDRQKRREGYADLADFILQNARRICEEWCKPEYAELRLKKYLRLREETLLKKSYEPPVTPDLNEEYKEMYEMIADSFRDNRDKVLLLLDLMKESLIDRPTRYSFMMWVSVSMIHAEAYQSFSTMYDPCSFMRGEYQSLQERYMALSVPIGVKKIPVVFMLFEIPRFFYYVEFLDKKLGRGPRSFLTSKDRAALALLGEDVTMRDEAFGVPVTSYQSVSDPDCDYVTLEPEAEQEDSEGELNVDCDRKPTFKALTRVQEPTKLAVMTTTPAPQQSPPPPHQPLVMSTDQFRSMLVDHLKANEASVANETNKPTYHRYIGGKLIPPLPLATRNALLSSARSGPRQGRSSRARKEARKARQLGVDEPDRRTVLVCQIDTDALRERGFHVGIGSRKTTIIASKDGTLEHILEGVETPEQVKSFLSHKYNITAQQQGTGYITVPSSDKAVSLALDEPIVEQFDRGPRFPKGTGNAKKKKKYRKPMAALPAPTYSPSTTTAAAAASSTTAKQEVDDGLSGFPFTANWTKERRDNFKQEILKGLGRAPTSVTTTVLPAPIHTPEYDEVPASKTSEEDQEGLTLSNALAKVLSPIDPLHSIKRELQDRCDERNIPMPELEVTHAPLEFTKSPPGCKEPVTVTLTTTLKLRPAGGEGIQYHSKTTDPPHITEIKDEQETLDPLLTVLPSAVEPPAQKTTAAIEKEKGNPEEPGERNGEGGSSRGKMMRKLKGRKMRERERERETAESKPSPDVENKDLESPTLPAAPDPVPQQQPPVSDSANPVAKEDPSETVPASLPSPDPCDIISSTGNELKVEDKAPATDEKKKSKKSKTARDRFKNCENCHMEITDRILLCAGCKKVAYCNYRCQKAHWKVHKKACSYALKKDSKDRTG